MKYTYSSADLNGSRSADGQERDRPVVPVGKCRHGAGFWAGAGCGVVSVLILVALFLWWLVRDAGAERRVIEDVVRESSSESERAQFKAARKARDRDLALYLCDTESEVRHLFEYVRQSSFIHGNEQYAKQMADVGFVYSETNDNVNAYAGADPSNVTRRVMNCYAGEVRIAKVLGLAAAAQICGKQGAIAKLMDRLSPRLCMRMTIEDAAELIQSCGFDDYLADEEIRTKAESIAAGEIVGTLAHETGHIVLGHLENRESKVMMNMEVRRNYESQADLVASSIMSTSPFGEYVFLGQAFCYWVNMQKTDSLIMENVPKNELDHPLNRERYVSFVLANKEKAAAYGFPIPEL